MVRLNGGITGSSWRHFVTFLAGYIASGSLDLTGATWEDTLVGLGAAFFAYYASILDKKKGGPGSLERQKDDEG